MAASLKTSRPGRRLGSFLRLGVLATLVGGMALGSVRLPAEAAAPVARAAVLATDATDFVPTAESLPPGFREVAAEATGSVLEPTIGLRRTFFAVDSARRIDVSVALSETPPEAQTSLTERVNQVVRYWGWRVTPGEPFGDTAYRAVGASEDGTRASLLIFRVNSILAEVIVSGDGGTGGPQLLETVARLIEERIQSDPDTMADVAGFPPPTPGIVPGYEPQVIVPANSLGVVQPGAVVPLSGLGVPGDTVVNLSVNEVARPWQGSGGSVRVPTGMEYLTVETQIDVSGQTELTLALSDFWVTTFDGRSWAPILGRTPGLPTGIVPFSSSRRGWLTFMVPANQPAIQLNWRVRTNELVTTQTSLDQTLVVPLTVGASASLSVGGSAPAGAPGLAPAGGSGPSAPSTAPSGSGSGSGSGGGAAPRSGTRLQ